MCRHFRGRSRRPRAAGSAERWYSKLMHGSTVRNGQMRPRIVGAVRQGRTLYDNILKFVRFQLSTTMGAIFTLFFSPLIGLPDALIPSRSSGLR